MKQDDPLGIAPHPLQRVLPAPVYPIGVHLHENQLGIGVIKHRLVHGVTVKELKFLVVVVVVEPHPAVRAQPSDLIEEVRSAKGVSAVTQRIELDVTADLGIADLCLVIQDRRQTIKVQRIDMASHHLQSNVGKRRSQLMGRQSEPNAVIGSRSMVRSLEIAVAKISNPLQRRRTRLSESVPHRVELKSNLERHGRLSSKR